MSDKVLRIEEKIAHLEHAVAELGDIVYVQQTRLEKLQAECSRLREILAASASTAEESGDERPPHY